MDKTVINPSEIGKQLAVPQIKVIEDGKEVVRPDVLQAVVQLATLGQLTRIRKSLEKEEFEGELVEQTLHATDEVQSIEAHYRPWATIYLVNDGPDAVSIAVNNPYTWKLLNKDESSSIDFTKGDKRIEIIYYVCNSSETAEVRLEAKY